MARLGLVCFNANMDTKFADSGLRFSAN